MHRLLFAGDLFADSEERCRAIVEGAVEPAPGQHDAVGQVNRNGHLGSDYRLKEATGRRTVPVEPVAVAPVRRCGGVGAAIEEVGDGAGEGGVDHGVDLATFVHAALREAPYTRPLAGRETIGNGDLTRHAAIIGKER